MPEDMNPADTVSPTETIVEVVHFTRRDGRVIMKLDASALQAVMEGMGCVWRDDILSPYPGDSRLIHAGQNRVNPYALAKRGPVEVDITSAYGHAPTDTVLKILGSSVQEAYETWKSSVRPLDIRIRIHLKK